jgi:hypothetical protein
VREKVLFLINVVEGFLSGPYASQDRSLLVTVDKGRANEHNLHLTIVSPTA